MDPSNPSSNSNPEADNQQIDSSLNSPNIDNPANNHNNPNTNHNILPSKLPGSRAKLITIISIVVGVAILAVGIVVFANILLNNIKEDSSADNAQEELVVDSSNIGERLASYQLQLAERYPNHTVGPMRDYDLPGQIGVVSPEHGFSVPLVYEEWAFMISGDIDIPMINITDPFHTDGFEMVEYSETTVRFTSADVLCDIYKRYATTTHIRCVDTSDLQEIADLFEPFYVITEEVLGASYKYSELDFRLWWRPATDAPNHARPVDKFPGYERTTLGVSLTESGFRANYHRVDGGEWVFSFGYQGMSDCDKHEHHDHTLDVAKAWYDWSCISSSEETTLGEYYGVI